MAKKMKHVGWMVVGVTGGRGNKYKTPLAHWETAAIRREDAIDNYEIMYGMKNNYKKDSRRKRNRVKAVKLFVEVGE